MDGHVTVVQYHVRSCDGHVTVVQYHVRSCDGWSCDIV